MEHLHHSEPQPRKKPIGHGVDVSHIGDKASEPLWKKSFTDNKVGPLSDEELDTIMDARAPWETKKPDNAPDAKVIAMQGHRDRRVGAGRKVIVAEAPTPTGEYGKAFDDSEKPLEIDDYNHDAINVPKSARNEQMSDEEREALHDLEAGVSREESQLAKEAMAYLATSTETISDEDGSGEVSIETATLSPDVSIQVITDQKGKFLDVVVIKDENDEVHEITTERLDDTDQDPTVLVDEHPMTPEEVPMVHDILEEVNADIAAERAAQEAETAGEQSEDAEAADDTTGETPIKPAVDSASQASVEQADKPSIESNMKNALMPYLRGNKGAEALFQTLADEQGIEKEDLITRFSKAEINSDPAAQQTLKNLMQDGAKPGSPVWEADPNSQSQLGAAAQESNQLLERALRELLK